MPLVHLVLSILLHLSQSLSFPPYQRDCLPDSWEGACFNVHSCQDYCSGQAMTGHSPPLCEGMSVSPQGCGSQSGEARVCYSEGTGLREPQLPSLSSLPLMGVGEILSQPHLSNPQPPCRPRCFSQTFPSLWIFHPWAEQQDCGSPNP